MDMLHWLYGKLKSMKDISGGRASGEEGWFIARREQTQTHPDRPKLRTPGRNGLYALTSRLHTHGRNVE